MAYGYRSVSYGELNGIVDRLSSPTQASRSWQYNYNAQEENLRYLQKNDPKVHRRRSVSPAKLTKIVGRLTRPTVASVACRWNYDCEDGNLMFLKKFDPNIRLPYKTVTPQQERSRPASQRSGRISVNDLTQFLDRSRPHSGPAHSRSSSSSSFSSNGSNG